MARRMLLYRGSLKSCNYSCSYCPFAKHKLSGEELHRDKENWLRFCSVFKRRNELFGAVMLVPYGEALIHPYYWEGMAQLSQLDSLEAIGAQTNLSFSVYEHLQIYKKAGGKIEKLRLWATFHPEMTTIPQFISQCEKLVSQSISFCVGAVGVPRQIPLLIKLRKALPESVYLWINRMDGLKRCYTKEEITAILEIDPYFNQELHWKKGEVSQCRDRLFLEADGSMRLCPLNKPVAKNWYTCPNASPILSCDKKQCSCYLAYGGRKDYKNQMEFGRYPLFRILWKPKAIFLDLDGTLLSEHSENEISEEWMSFIRQKAQDCHLILATSRPLKDAAKKCPELLPFLSGGIYSSGAHVALFGQEGIDRKESFSYIDECSWLPHLLSYAEQKKSRVIMYRDKASRLYKITLLKPRMQKWKQEEIETVTNLPTLKQIRYFIEGNCFQLLNSRSNKGMGVLKICEFLGIHPFHTAAIGNSEEDLPMFRTCGYSVAMDDSPAHVKDEADLIYHGSLF